MEYQHPTTTTTATTIAGAAAAAQSTPKPSYSAALAPPEARLERSFTSVTGTAPPTDLRTTKAACEYSLREYAALQNRRRYYDDGDDSRLRAQQDLVLGDLHNLRREVSALVKEAESDRWRHWILGGVVASLIPAVRKLFRRSSKDKESNDTEYAFRRSKSLIARILGTVRGKGGLASLAFFVLAVLYIFESEVSLRVARTVSKRLKKLSTKIENGDQSIGEDDLKVLKGWRWRILLW
ncbi:hypothetical protein F4775DRAFT_278664 [Biscogniauxia sp. FL1348]|nr:hypothetical protein F4775DRAFT_278664 [Biscogniauxia sp. FL1348]